MFDWFNSFPPEAQWAFFFYLLFANIVLWTLVWYWVYAHVRELGRSEAAEEESGDFSNQRSPRQSEPLPTHNPRISWVVTVAIAHFEFSTFILKYLSE